jgi:hypothetical protein
VNISGHQIQAIFEPERVQLLYINLISLYNLICAFYATYLCVGSVRQEESSHSGALRWHARLPSARVQCPYHQTSKYLISFNQILQYTYTTACSPSGIVQRVPRVLLVSHLAPSPKLQSPSPRRQRHRPWPLLQRRLPQPPQSSPLRLPPQRPLAPQ